MINSRKERISQLIEALGLSKNKFAKAIGTSSAVVSNITTTDVNYGVEFVEKIISTFPRINPTWLLTGIGEMMLTEKDAERHLERHPYPHYEDEQASKMHPSGGLNRLTTSAQRARVAFGDRVQQEQLKARLDRQRQIYQKANYHIESQEPDLAEHRRQLEKLGWLLNDAKEAASEHLTVNSANSIFALLSNETTVNQSFEQILGSMKQDLEASLPYAPAVATFIDALTTFLAAIPPASEPEPELREDFQRGLSDKLRKTGKQAIKAK